MKLRILVALLFMITALAVFVNTNAEEPTINIAHAQDGDACLQLVQQALTNTSLNCAGLGSNSVCSGSGQTNVKSSQNGDVALGNPGDYFSLEGIANIETENTDDFNVVLANLPGAASDKIVMLLLGDINLQSAAAEASNSNSIQTFNLSTEINSTCGNVLPSSMVLQSEPGMKFDIIVNGAHIQAGSTVFVRTTGPNTMRVSVGQGTAVVFPNTVNEIVVPAGYQVDIPLDENGQAYGLWERWDIGENEIVLFEPLERLPENVLNGPYSGPTFFQGSGVGGPPPVVVPPVDVPPVAVPFPVPGVTPGPGGTDLPEDVAFEGIDVGPEACIPTVIFNNDSDDDWDLYRLSGLENLSNGDRDDIQPTLSQDYEWIAFTSNRESVTNWEIFIVDRDGENLQRVTYNTGKDINPVWGPDGQLIFESDRDGNWELYWVDVADSRTLTRLTEDEEGTRASDINAFWADAETIYFQSDRDGDYEIYKLDLSTLETTQITDNDVEDSYPNVSSDGTMLAWVQENESGTLDLWMMDLETEETEQLTDTGTNVFGIAFAPDNTFIAYNTNLGDGNDVFAVSVEDQDADGNYVVKNLTNNPATDEDDEYDDISPAFRCNSSNVIFHSDRINEQDDLYEVNPLPLTGAYAAPTRLTFSEEDFDIFPLGDPREELNSRLNQLP